VVLPAVTSFRYLFYLCNVFAVKTVYSKRWVLSDCSQVCFSCDSVQLASRLVQDMAQYFGITVLSSEADFPKDLENLRQLLTQVADYNANRVKLSTDMADMCNMVKERVVKAEDCRIIMDIARSRSAYVEIHDINLKLRQQYTKREANHQQLLACLKGRPLLYFL
jgi:Bardet-Biedl syndrome 2 protein